MNETPTVPCRFCRSVTPMLGTGLCDNCWELEKRLRTTRHSVVAQILRAAGYEDHASIDMLLYCPGCGAQHVDEPEPAQGWLNPPHRTHQCRHCKHEWRPSDVFTNGVKEIKTAKVHGAQPHLYVDERFDKVVRRIHGEEVQYHRSRT